MLRFGSALVFVLQRFRRGKPANPAFRQAIKRDSDQRLSSLYGRTAMKR